MARDRLKHYRARPLDELPEGWQNRRPTARRLRVLKFRGKDKRRGKAERRATPPPSRRLP